MINNILFVVGLIFTLVYGWGYYSRQEYQTHTNSRIIIHWAMALGFFFVNDVPSIHLIYTFPLGILLAFAGIRFGIRANPMTVLFISVIIWSFVLMGLSDYFGTFS